MCELHGAAAMLAVDGRVPAKLAAELGWGYADVVKQYEDKRRERSAAWYEKRKAEKAAFAKAKA